MSVIIKKFKCKTMKINHENFYLKRNLLILKNFSPRNISAILYVMSNSMCKSILAMVIPSYSAVKQCIIV